MDPYLEEPGGWPGFHNKLVVEIEAALNRQLMPAYYADIDERVYISDESDPGRKVIIPDVKVVRTGHRGGAKPVRGVAGRRPPRRCASQSPLPPCSTTRCASRT
jgi:hypothetical protein